jgi:hypothetical protein
MFEILNVYFIMPMPGSQQMDSLRTAYFLYSYRWISRILFAAFIAAGIAGAINTRRRWIPVLALIAALFIIYIFNFRMTAEKMFRQPRALVMQADEASKIEYDSLRAFEKGRSKSKLTRSDTVSWENKSWVIGLQVNATCKAYDWNQLKKENVIHDVTGEQPIVLALFADRQSYAAFLRTDRNDYFILRHDTLFSKKLAYDLSGKCLSESHRSLKKIKAYQEFWHSWKTFHPGTLRYPLTLRNAEPG